jgi:hypothetical protein
MTVFEDVNLLEMINNSMVEEELKEFEKNTKVNPKHVFSVFQKYFDIEPEDISFSKNIAHILITGKKLDPELLQKILKEVKAKELITNKLNENEAIITLFFEKKN